MQAPQATQAQSRVRGGAFASAFVGRRGRYRHRPVPAPAPDRYRSRYRSVLPGLHKVKKRTRL